ncbi:MAG: hypothetical protein ACTTJ8_09505 [Treponema sp.]
MEAASLRSIFVQPIFMQRVVMQPVFMQTAAFSQRSVLCCTAAVLLCRAALWAGCRQCD